MSESPKVATIPNCLLARVFEILAEKYRRADPIQDEQLGPWFAEILARLMPDSLEGTWAAYELRGGAK